MIAQPVDRGAAPTASAAGATFAALLVLLAWAPVPLGSNRGWSQALLAAGFLGLGVAVLVCALWRGHRVAPRLAPAAWPTALLVAFAGFTFLQLLPLPGPLLDVLSPAARDAWRAAGVEGAASLSLDRGASAARGVHLASLAVLFALVPWCVDSFHRLRQACVVLVAVGAVQALIGIATALARTSGWVAAGPMEGVGGASGTFVNPNHFAGLLEMTLCVSVGLAMSLGGGGGLPASGHAAASRMLAFVLSPRMLLAGAQALMVVALLWSGSRGAVAALALALAVVVVVALPPRPGLALLTRLGGVAAAVVVAATALAWAGPGSLGAKLAARGLDSDRGELVRSTLAMAGDFPLAGAGAGSFPIVFPAYKSEALGTPMYEHAHNDYLEILAESGAVGLALFLAAAVGALALAVKRARRRRSRPARALTAGCAAAAASLLLHGLYDFNLQVPANATLFVAVLALAVTAATLQREAAPRPAP